MPSGGRRRLHRSGGIALPTAPSHICGGRIPPLPLPLPLLLLLLALLLGGPPSPPLPASSASASATATAMAMAMALSLPSRRHLLTRRSLLPCLLPRPAPPPPPPSRPCGLPTRLLGSRSHPDNPPGDVTVSSSLTGTGTVQTTPFPDLDLPRMERTLSELRDLIGYRTYDVTLMLVDDDEMRRTNLETRGIDAPTDVLSFPFQDAVEIGTGEGEGGGEMTTTTTTRRTPGVLADPEFDVPDYYSLGEMMVDVPYVIRRCEEDLAAGAVGGDGDGDERGVSGAMATVADPEERIHMLLVHGMLHLVGYDHIKDEDYWPMVEREEELLAALRERGLLRGGGSVTASSWPTGER